MIHGVLLVVMLVYGYRTWTRDKTIKPDLGAVVLWEKSESDLASIEFKSDKKITKLERRSQGGETYWWGSETTIEKKPKPVEPPKPAEGSGAGSAAGSAAGSGAGSAAKPAAAGSAAGSGAGSGSAAGSGAGSAAGSGAGSGSAAPPAVVEEEVRKVHEFPLGETGDNLIKSYAKARALRDLGQPTEDQKKDYKLSDAKTTLTVTFKDGGTRSFLVGGPVYGGSDRYVADQQSKRAYVFSKDLVASIEVGESSLHLIEPRGYEVNRIESVTIEGDGKSMVATRVQTGDNEGQQVKTWGNPTTKKPDQTVANFIDNTNNLRPTEYKPDVKVSDLTLILKLTFKDARGDRLGTLQLFKHEKPAELPPNTDLDPANPPTGETEYLILTEKTRVPALVRRDTAQRTEQDIATVFSSDHPTEPPKGNPFGTTGVQPGTHGGGPPPMNPHGGGAPAGGAPAGGAPAGGAPAGGAPAGGAPKTP